MRDETRQVEDETVKWALSDVAPMSDEAFARGKAALLAQIAAAEPHTEVSESEKFAQVVPPAPRRRRRIPVMAAAAAMVLIAGVALIAPALMTRDKVRGVGSASAAEVLNRTASATGDVSLEPGQYLQVMLFARWSARDNEYRWMYLQDQTLQTWIPADSKDTWLYRRDKVGAKKWLLGSPEDYPADLPESIETEGEWRSEGGRALAGKMPVSFRDPTLEYIARLPHDPRELYERLRGEAGGDGDRDLLQMITDGLDTGMYPAATRSAIYHALAYLPGLEIVDRTAVLDNREGTALGITVDNETTQIVVDQKTGEYLGSRTVQVRDAHGLKAGTVLGSTTLNTRVVSGIGATS